MDALKAVWNQFLKDSDKLPGWVPLFVVMLVVVDWATSPDHISLWGRTVPLSREFLAAALTLLFYTVGDAIDEVVFKTGQEGARGTRAIWKNRYAEQLKTAGCALGVGNGLYSVTLKLVTAGEKHRGTRLGIHIPNEAAKCLRALILPLAILAVPFFARGRVPLALTCLTAAAGLLLTYPLQKVRRLRRLYVSASALAQKERLYHDEELGAMRWCFGMVTWLAQHVAFRSAKQLGIEWPHRTPYGPDNQSETGFRKAPRPIADKTALICGNYKGDSRGVTNRSLLAGMERWRTCA